MATRTHCLTGDDVPVCSRIKHESSSSDDEHAAAKLSSASHLPLLSSVGYKKTLRLTSEQLVSRVPLLVCGLWPRRGPPGPGGQQSGCPSRSLAPTQAPFLPLSAGRPPATPPPALVPRVSTLTPAPGQAGSAASAPPLSSGIQFSGVRGGQPDGSDESRRVNARSTRASPAAATFREMFVHSDASPDLGERKCSWWD